MARLGCEVICSHGNEALLKASEVWLAVRDKLRAWVIANAA